MNEITFIMLSQKASQIQQLLVKQLLTPQITAKNKRDASDAGGFKSYSRFIRQQCQQLCRSMDLHIIVSQSPVIKENAYNTHTVHRWSQFIADNMDNSTANTGGHANTGIPEGADVLILLSHHVKKDTGLVQTNNSSHMSISVVCRGYQWPVTETAIASPFCCCTSCNHITAPKCFSTMVIICKVACSNIKYNIQ